MARLARRADRHATCDRRALDGGRRHGSAAAVSAERSLVMRRALPEVPFASAIEAPRGSPGSGRGGGRSTPSCAAGCSARARSRRPARAAARATNDGGRGHARALRELDGARCADASPRAARKGVVRAPPAGAHPPPDAGPAAARDRPCLDRRLHALPVPLAARSVRHAAASGATGWRPSSRSCTESRSRRRRGAQRVPLRVHEYAPPCSTTSGFSGVAAWGRFSPPASESGALPGQRRRRTASTRNAPLAVALRRARHAAHGAAAARAGRRCHEPAFARRARRARRAAPRRRVVPRGRRARPASCRRPRKKRSGSWSRAPRHRRRLCRPAHAADTEEKRRPERRLRALRGGPLRRTHAAVGRWALLRPRAADVELVKHDPRDPRFEQRTDENAGRRWRACCCAATASCCAS